MWGTSVTVQQFRESIKPPSFYNQHNTTLVDGERWVDSKSTMSREQRTLSALDRTRNQALHGIPCHQALRSWRALASVHPIAHIASWCRTLTIPRISLTAEKQRSAAIRVRCLYLPQENDIPIISFCQKTLQITTSRYQTRTSLQMFAQNGQARRWPVEPPGSNTRVCIDFFCMTFIFQKLL